MSRIIGIDLGTTNSCVAVLEGLEPLVIPNSEGSRTTPSVVAFTGEGEPLVGQIAKRQAVTNAENTVSAVKRLMGRKFADPEADRHAQNSTYTVMASDNGDAWVNIQGGGYAPAQISAFILDKMKRIAEEYLGETVTDAVVTVPAYFGDSQRQATKDAGRIAGLNVRRIINEPTAAALAYGRLSVVPEAKIAVYDLGGGTFDVSLLHLHEGVYQVKATTGDGFLGGEDIDARIIGHLADSFNAQYGVDLRDDRMALQRLREAAERAKHELSSSLETEINLPFIAATADGPKHLMMSLTRSKLESLSEDLISRTLPLCEKVLADAGWNVSDVDEVILVGGQTRMPRVQDLVAGFFGKKGSRAINPDEAVAVGAALQGAVLSGEQPDVLLLDVTPLSLGVETAGGVFTRIIPNNTTVPVRRSRIFSTAVDNQPYVNVHVLQGEREMAADNKSLAHFQLTGIPPAPRGAPQIEVSFDIDSNGMVSVSAKDLGTGKAQGVMVQPTSGLSEAEIERFIGEADTNRATDLAKKELADLHNNAETLIYGTESTLHEFGDKLAPAAREQVQIALDDCKHTLEAETDNLTRLRAAIDRLETEAHAIFLSLQGGSASDGTPVEGEWIPVRGAPSRDHYEVLEVDRKSGAAEIKAAYRRLALQHHPDRNPGNRAAEERFKEISLAYAVLGDEEKRAHYDRFGSVTADMPFGGEADIRVVTDFFDAVFGDLFGTGRKRAAGQDLRFTLELDFAEAALGCEKEIRFTRSGDCVACRGTGAEGGAAGLAPCERCGGQGFLRQKAGFLSTRRECQACGGSGEVARVRCAACTGTGLADNERVFTVRVPAGSQGGSTQRVGGEGSPGRRGGPAGDLHVIVRVKPDPFYRQDGDILVVEAPLSVDEAALGAEIDIPLLDTVVRMKIPAATQPGAVFRVRGKGLPRPHGGRGDAHVHIAVEVPAAVPDAARLSLEKLALDLGDSAYPRREAFRDRARASNAK